MCTYNYNSRILQPVNFRAKYAVNWRSSSGVIIERGLIDRYKSISASERTSFIQGVMNSVNEAKKLLAKFYQSAESAYILEKHAYIYKKAVENPNMNSNINSKREVSSKLAKILTKGAVVNSIDMLGTRNLEAALDLGMDEFHKFCVKMRFLKLLIDKDNFDLLESKINPENTRRYRELQEGVNNNKEKINQLLGKKGQAKKRYLENKINALGVSEWNSSKVEELESKIQSLYKDNENSAEINSLMQDINTKQMEMKEILSKKLDISPKEIVKQLDSIAILTLRSGEFLNGDNVFFDLDAKDWSKSLVDKANEYIEYLYADILNATIGFIDEEIHSKFSNKEIKVLEDSLMVNICNTDTINVLLEHLIKQIKCSCYKDDTAWNNHMDKYKYDNAGLNYLRITKMPKEEL